MVFKCPFCGVEEEQVMVAEQVTHYQAWSSEGYMNTLYFDEGTSAEGLVMCYHCGRALLKLPPTVDWDKAIEELIDGSDE